MIEILGRSGPPEALLCPAFVCDACRDQVTGRGSVIHSVRYAGEDRESSPLFVAHSGACDQGVTEWLRTAYLSADGWSVMWLDIEPFMRQLAHNLTHPFADDREGEYHSHRLVGWGGER